MPKKPMHYQQKISNQNRRIIKNKVFKAMQSNPGISLIGLFKMNIAYEGAIRTYYMMARRRGII